MAKRSPGKNAASVIAINPHVGKEATGTEKPVLMMRLIKQAIDALWIPEGASEEARNECIHSTIALLQGIKPADEIEGMLAAQMVGAHTAAMECLRRAMIPNQTFAAVEQRLKHATKLMSIYARQIDALNKHRGKGQQKFIVEHVHVEAGGQAVVGHIETAPNSSRSRDQSKDTHKAITQASGKALDMSSRTRVSAKRRNK